MVEILLFPKSQWLCEDKANIKRGKSIEENACQYISEQLNQARRCYQLEQYDTANLYLDQIMNYYNNISFKNFECNLSPEKLVILYIPYDPEGIKGDYKESLDPGNKNRKKRDIDRLMASAYSIKGRINEERAQESKGDCELDMNEEAQDGAFKKAFSIFNELWDILEDLTGDEYNDYGITLYHMKKPAKASKVLKKAISINIANSETYLYLGIINNAMGNYTEAEYNLIEYLKKSANNIQVSKIIQVNRILAELNAANGHTIYAAEKYKDIADILIRDGKFETSINIIELAWEQSLKLNHDGRLSPLQINLLERKGLILLKLGLYKEALDAINMALEDDKDNALVWAHKGIALYSVNLYDDALVSLDQALKLKENISWALAIKGATLAAIGRHREAEFNLVAALKSDGKDIIALWGMGQFLLNKGRYEGALIYLNKALRLEPKDINAIRSKGYCLIALGKNNEALESINSGLKSNGNNPWLLADKTLAHICKGDYDSAANELRSALQADPMNPWALKLKGKLLCDIAEYNNAIQVLDQVIQMDPYDHQCIFLKAWALEQQSKENASISLQEYKKAIELNPEDTLAHKGLADTLRLSNDFESASKEYRWIIDKLEKKADPSPDDLSLMGMCRCCLGQYREGIRLITNSLNARPNSLNTHFDLALALLDFGMKEHALHHYQQGLDLAHKAHIFRHRGLLAVALNNLVNEINMKPEINSAEVQRVKDALSIALENAKLPIELCWILSV